MKYFSENSDFINAECEHCKRVLKIKREQVIPNSNGFSLKLPGGIRCICEAIHYNIIGTGQNIMHKNLVQQSQPKTVSNFKIIIGSIMIGIIFFGLIKTCSNSSNTSYSSSDNTGSQKLNLRQDQISYLENLQSQGYISIEAEQNKVYVAPLLWLRMDAKLKEDFAASLAIYCGNKKGTELYWVEIYDKQSGKKLAKYSQSWGFDVY